MDRTTINTIVPFPRVITLRSSRRGEAYFMTIKENWLVILALVYWTAQIIRAAL